jgi:hypothetical protein
MVMKKSKAKFKMWDDVIDECDGPALVIEEPEWHSELGWLYHIEINSTGCSYNCVDEASLKAHDKDDVSD